MPYLKILVIVLILPNGKPYDYSDFNTWPEECRTKQTIQDPINIETNNLLQCTMQKVKFTLFDGNSLIQPKGIALTSKFGGNKISLLDQNNKFMSYSSEQFHLHSPSQHQINSKKGDLELHIVHQLDPYYVANYHQAVLGIIFKQDPLAQRDIFDELNFIGDQKKISFANLNQILQQTLDNGNYFYYRGSLTTPGCDQVVKWFILQEMLPVRPQNLAKIRAAINNGNDNARNLQPSKNRPIYNISNQCNKGQLQILSKPIQQNNFNSGFVLGCYFGVISTILLGTALAAYFNYTKKAKKSRSQENIDDQQLNIMLQESAC